MSLEQRSGIPKWDAITWHGSNAKGSLQAIETGFYRQIEQLPAEMLVGMSERIKEGLRRFDNLPYDATILRPELFSITAPSIGEQEWVAKLILWGDFPNHGVLNPVPERDRETIVYAKVSGFIWTPTEIKASLVEGRQGFDRMTELYEKLKDDERMRNRIKGLDERMSMIDEAKRFQTSPEPTSEPKVA